MIIARCTSCGLPFGKRPGQRFPVCMPCFKTDQGWTLTKADEAHRATMEALANTQRCWHDDRDELLHLRLEVIRLTGMVAGHEARVPETDIPVHDLLRLVHPDRHPDGLSDLANRVTRWVLAQR